MTLVLWDVLFFHQKKVSCPRQQGNLHLHPKTVWFREEGAWLDPTMWWMESTICAYLEQEIDLKFFKPLQLPGKLHWPN